MADRNQWQKEYNKRTDYAAQKKYTEKVTTVLVRLNPDTDADILSRLDPSRPMATQIKELLRRGFEMEQTDFTITLE